MTMPELAAGRNSGPRERHAGTAIAHDRPLTRSAETHALRRDTPIRRVVRPPLSARTAIRTACFRTARRAPRTCIGGTLTALDGTTTWAAGTPTARSAPTTRIAGAPTARGAPTTRIAGTTSGGGGAPTGRGAPRSGRCVPLACTSVPRACVGPTASWPTRPATRASDPRAWLAAPATRWPPPP